MNPCPTRSYCLTTTFLPSSSPFPFPSPFLSLLRSLTPSHTMPKVPTPLFRKSVFAYEILPIYAVVIGAVGGAGWYLSRLARGPDVIWDRNGNPQPWQHIKENQQVKLLAINHKHEGEPWRRDRF